jgi:hypothetical protein
MDPKAASKHKESLSLLNSLVVSYNQVNLTLTKERILELLDSHLETEDHHTYVKDNLLNKCSNDGVITKDYNNDGCLRFVISRDVNGNPTEYHYIK